NTHRIPVSSTRTRTRTQISPATLLSRFLSPHGKILVVPTHHRPLAVRSDLSAPGRRGHTAAPFSHTCRRERGERRPRPPAPTLTCGPWLRPPGRGDVVGAFVFPQIKPSPATPTTPRGLLPKTKPSPTLSLLGVGCAARDQRAAARTRPPRPPAEMASISGAAAPPSSSSACRLRLRRQLLMRPSHLRLRAPHSIADLSRSSSSGSSHSHAPAPPLASRAPAQGGGAVEKDPIKLWDRYVEWLYQHKQLGLFVDVSRMGFTDDFLQRMEPLMQRAFVAMGELEKGAIANPDEGRMVGHYWLRDPGLAPNSFLRTKIEKTVDHILAFSQDIVSGKIKPPSSQVGRFTQILSIGIGGSSLGPQFVSEALAPDNPPLKIRFIDNTDPAGIDHQIAQLGEELKSTLVIVISKSGGTPETRNGLLEVQKAFRDAGLDFSKQGVAITQENSLLDNTARIEGWLDRFPMFDWVGGRTSELSAVGLLPAALQGIDVKEMLVGAALMDEETRNTVG
uniref:Glucose-6-phosphate isomerase n=2 Tax=Aegilops tauschii subsp. strangulata TaxID=200361 RepID=A0A453L0R7_AEGTS